MKGWYRSFVPECFFFTVLILDSINHWVRSVEEPSVKDPPLFVLFGRYCRALLSFRTGNDPTLTRLSFFGAFYWSFPVSHNVKWRVQLRFVGATWFKWGHRNFTRLGHKWSEGATFPFVTFWNIAHETSKQEKWLIEWCYSNCGFQNTPVDPRRLSCSNIIVEFLAHSIAFRFLLVITIEAHMGIFLPLYRKQTHGCAIIISVN